MIKEKTYYTSPIFKNITHGFFSKKGGVSTGIYDSLNCGKSSLDYENNIIKNRKIVSNILGFDAKSLVIGNQFHSNKVVVINKYKNDLKCDAIISLSKNIAVGVLTADCCPVLVAHKENLIVASIHLGWKGLFNGILDNFLYETKKLKIKTNPLSVIEETKDKLGSFYLNLKKEREKEKRKSEKKKILDEKRELQKIKRQAQKECYSYR